LLPGWQGNDRIDTLRNIVRDGRFSLYFRVPGSTTSLRVNGTARITAGADRHARFEGGGKHPRTVLVIRVAEVCAQCAGAAPVGVADLWRPVGMGAKRGHPAGTGRGGDIDGAAHDADRATRAHPGWWQGGATRPDIAPSRPVSCPVLSLP